MAENKNIVWALKNKSTRVSIGSGDRWLYWDETSKEWVVMEHRYRRKRSSELVRTESETLAVGVLCED